MQVTCAADVYVGCLPISWCSYSIYVAMHSVQLVRRALCICVCLSDVRTCVLVQLLDLFGDGPHLGPQLRLLRTQRHHHGTLCNMKTYTSICRSVISLQSLLSMYTHNIHIRIYSIRMCQAMGPPAGGSAGAGAGGGARGKNTTPPAFIQAQAHQGPI